jgi:outer membrane protein OmpA-like peptidoglycan-associated protein
MEGEATLLLHQLSLQSTDSEDGLASKLPVPMDVALDTLRDKNNTIKLNIPIKGDADQPEFDISDAINQAVAKAVVLGASTYLKYVLQPYGSLLMVAEYAGEAATRVRLDPIEFEPGQAALDDTDRDYLSKVAQILKDRPQIAIKLCGVAVKRDALHLQQQRSKDKKEKSDKSGSMAEIPVDTEQLRTLAEQRAAAVKDYLIEHFQAPANRIVGCRPRIETDESEKTDRIPRTDILI